MDPTEDLSARVLLKHILSTETPRTPITRSPCKTQSSSATRSSNRLSRKDAGAQTPQDILRRSLRHKVRESIIRQSLPATKRRTASVVLRKLPSSTSMLFDDGDTPRHILKNILLTEPVKSPVVHEKAASEEPQPSSAASSITRKRPSSELSGLDLPDLTIGNIESTAKALSRKRPRRSLNVTAFEKRLKDGEDVEENEESVGDHSSLSLSSSTSLSLKTPFVDVRTEKKGLQRRVSNRRKISEEEFGAAVNKRQLEGVSSFMQLERGLSETALSEGFTLGQSKLSEFDITADILHCDTALYARPDAMTSSFSFVATQDKPTVMVSQLQRQMEQKDQMEAEQSKLGKEKSTYAFSTEEGAEPQNEKCFSQSEEDVDAAEFQKAKEKSTADGHIEDAAMSEEEECIAESQTSVSNDTAEPEEEENGVEAEEGAADSHTEEDAATRSQSEEEDIAPDSQTEEEGGDSQIEKEIAVDLQCEEDVAARSHSEEEEDVAVRSQSEEEEDVAAVSQSEEEEDVAVRSHSEEEEGVAAGSQSEEEEDVAARSQSEEEEDVAAGSQSEEEEDVAAVSQSEEDEDVAVRSQSEEEEGAPDCQTEEEGAVDLQSEEDVAARSHSEEEGDVAVRSQSEEEEDVAVRSQSEEEEDVAAVSQSEEDEDVAVRSQSEEEEGAPDCQTEEEGAVDLQSEEDVAARSHSEEEGDVAVRSQSEEEEDVAVRSQSEEEEDVAAVSQSEEDEDVAVRSQSEEEEGAPDCQTEEEGAVDLQSEEDVAARSHSEEEGDVAEHQSDQEDSAANSQSEEEGDLADPQPEDEHDEKPWEDDGEQEQDLEHISQRARRSEGVLIMPVKEAGEDLADATEAGWSDGKSKAHSSLEMESRESFGIPDLAESSTQGPKDACYTEAEPDADKESSFNLPERTHDIEESRHWSDHSPEEAAQREEEWEDDEEEEDEEESDEIPSKTPAFVRQKRNFFQPDPQASPSVFKNIQASSSTGEAFSAPKPKQVRQRRKGPAKKEASLPKSYLMGVFKHFAKTTVSADVYPVLQDIMDKYFDRLAVDLETYAVHAKRKTIEVEDAELLLKRQGHVNDKVPVEVLIEKYLRMDQRKLLIPIATSGNVVIPKTRR